MLLPAVLVTLDFLGWLSTVMSPVVSKVNKRVVSERKQSTHDVITLCCLKCVS